jgi:hypothetical protein
MRTASTQARLTGSCPGMIDGVNLHGRAERAYGSRLNPDLTLDQKPSGTIMCNIDALKQRRRIQAKARRGLNYPMPSCPAAHETQKPANPFATRRDRGARCRPRRRAPTTIFPGCRAAAVIRRGDIFGTVLSIAMEHNDDVGAGLKRSLHAAPQTRRLP